MNYLGRFIFYSIFFSILFIASSIPILYFSISLELAFSITMTWLFVFFSLSASYPLADLLGKRRNSYVFKWVTAVSMGACSIGVPIGILGLAALYFGLNPLALSICLFFSWTTTIIVSILFVKLPPKLTKIELNVGIKNRLHIIQISDVHLNGLRSVKSLQQWVQRINDLSPDLIVFTGDLLDIPAHLQEEELTILATLNAKVAKLAVSGNHDFYSHRFDFPEILEKMGFQYLDNSCYVTDDYAIIGLADKAGIRHGIKRKAISELSNKTADKFTILLDHRPDDFKLSANSGVDLQLSGHTHWGQIPPWGLLVKLRYKYGIGLGRYKRSVIYTSKGIGAWGPPMRFFGRSEIVSIALN